MRALARAAACGVFVTGLLAAVGCGGATGQPTGKVTRNGKPVPDAEITFTSATNSRATVHGSTGPDGVYHLSYIRDGGLPPGKYTVTVAFYTLRNGKPLPDGEEGAALRGDDEKVIRHAVEYDRDIAAGGNPHDFELTEGRKVTE
jgi:hypothetical protein